MPPVTDGTAASRRWTRLFVALLALGCLVAIAVPAGLGWDFANFYDAGRRVAAGEVDNLYSPDSLIAGAPPQGSTGFYGTPISALFYLPIGGFSAETALVLFKIQNVLAFGAAFLVLFRFYRTHVPGDHLARSRFAAIFAFLVLIYQPFWTVFRVGGQTTPTALLLLALALVFHTSARFWGSAICLVLAILIKPALAYALIFLACVAGRAFLWRAACVAAAAGLLSVAALGWPVHASFLDLMQRGSRLTYAWYFNSSIYILIDNLRLAAGAAAAEGGLRVALAAATYALKAAVVLTLAVLAVRGRRAEWTGAARRHFDFTLATLFFLLWSPTVWEHYLSFLFPLLIYVVASRERFSRETAGLVAAIFVLSIGQNLILINWIRERFVFDSLPALLGVALVKSGPLLLTLVLLWRHGGELLRSHAAPAWTQSPLPIARAQG